MPSTDRSGHPPAQRLFQPSQVRTLAPLAKFRIQEIRSSHLNEASFPPFNFGGASSGHCPFRNRAWSILLRPPITVTSFLFSLPIGTSRHSVPHGKTRPAETDFPALLNMRGASEVHNEHARPADRANVSHVRLPVRQQNVDFREGCGIGSRASRDVSGTIASSTR